MLDFIIIFVLLALITVWWQTEPFHWMGKGIPYKIPWPILGNAGQAFTKPMYLLWRDLYSKHRGKLVGIHMFMNPALLINDPKVIKKILTEDFQNFVSRDMHVEDYDPLDGNLLHSTGEQWRTVRSKLSPFFTPSKLKAMMSLIKITIDEMVTNLNQVCSQGDVNVCDFTQKMSVDVIVTTIFGLEGDCFKNPDSFFLSLNDEFTNPTVAAKFLLSLLSPKLFKRLRLTLMSRKTNEKLIDFVKRVIDMRKKGVGVREDFLQGMVELNKKENISGDNKKYYSDGTTVPRFDMKGITAQCVLLYAAGTETTSSTLYFLLYEISMNQQIQNKMRQEITQVFGKYGQELTYEHITHLNYTDTVIKETLRKYPIIFHNTRKCSSNCMLEGLEIRKGTSMVIPTIDIHRDPQYYPEPDKFLPERFQNEANITPGTYLPFGMGPRVCIGMKMAQMTLSMALCSLLTKFKFNTCNKTEREITLGFTTMLSPKNGIWLQVEPI